MNEGGVGQPFNLFLADRRSTETRRVACHIVGTFFYTRVSFYLLTLPLWPTWPVMDGQSAIVQGHGEGEENMPIKRVVTR